MSDFFFRALLAGSLFSIMAGPLGSIIIWRRLAFFGDTLAHSALLGISLSFFFHLPPTLGILVFSIALGVALIRFSAHKALALDTLLAIFSHASLGFGLVALSLSSGLQTHFNQYLFGDILAIDQKDLLMLAVGVVVVIGTTWFYWQRLLTTIISEELAISEGIPVHRIKLVFMVLLAVCVSVALKIVGALLLTALLIIPAATARYFAKTPAQMTVSASVVAILSVIIGLFGSLQFDLPTAPLIVCSAFCVFFFSRIMSRFFLAV
jgi:zinc transport system permease protein